MLNIVPRVVAYTSCNRSYLPRAYLLAQTLREAHPDWEIQALITDDPLDDAEAAAFEAVFDRLVYAADLGFERFRSWIFKHDVVEACTAVKGRMLRRLLAANYDRVVYFDPDIAVFHRLDTVVDCLETASVVLTPHQLAANDEAFAITDNELCSLRYGVFNLGFLAVANDAVGRDFADWWDGHLTRACYDEPALGIFTDQKYCDLVPSLFDRVAIVRDPGCNVASWNISRRSLAVTPDGDILVNGSLLKFYHFTKIFDVRRLEHGRHRAGELVPEHGEGHRGPSRTTPQTLAVRRFQQRACDPQGRAGCLPAPRRPDRVFRRSVRDRGQQPLSVA
jgi:hypothetical protein